MASTHSLSLSGKICLVTGATNGIGQVAARELAARGATVVVAGRSRTKCLATVEGIKRVTGNDQVDYLVADLSIQNEVRSLAAQFLARYQRLHILVNNAGAVFFSRRQSANGLELTFALNHLNYFLLTNLLLDTIKASAPARIINVSSRAHSRVPGINFDDLQSQKSYQGMRVYGQSKLANILFTAELSKRLAGSGVTANSLHPGVVATGFGANNAGPLGRLGRRVFNLFSITPEAGARTIVYLATSPEVEGVTGRYFQDEKAIAPSRAAQDAQAAARLWQISEKLTGLSGGAA
jgi:retinol dehydrogenase-12